MSLQKKYLIAFRGARQKWNQTSESEWDALNRQHTVWMEKLKGRISAAGKLAPLPCRTLRGNTDSPVVTDGPFSETKEMLTGFYLIEAESFDQAVTLAKGCPWLLHDVMDLYEVES